VSECFSLDLEEQKGAVAYVRWSLLRKGRNINKIILGSLLNGSGRLNKKGNKNQ
jgi:hypothetical protein